MAKKQRMPLLWIGDSITLDLPNADEFAEVVHGKKPSQTTKTKRSKKRKVKSKRKLNAA